MNSELRKITLYGILRARFGKEYNLAVETPREAVRALCVLIDGFEQFLFTSKQRGITYAVFVGKTNIGEDELESAKGKTDIRIAPVLMGSKKGGLFQTIFGAALVGVASFFTGGMAAAFAASGLWGATALMGASMFLGGVVQMLSPQPKGVGARQSAENTASYAFGGPVNTVAQGNPVAIGYGERRIGGAIISAGVYAEDKT
ncbi:tail assembly protein [Yersinia enterocolitica]|uniref:tail assembly protein n=1 Tax=Yersinia enterocolitica TaxID=630 RepID=UPI001C60CA28|nr:tail assembly protein [Yersinia enterocolitica]MBW5852967.1 tail assembly protein [Yersinia enterocolitica]